MATEANIQVWQNTPASKNNGETLLFQDHSIPTSIEWPKFQSGPVKFLPTPILSVSMIFLKKGCLPPTIERYQ
jgi:hypothetical protein